MISRKDSDAAEAILDENLAQLAQLLGSIGVEDLPEEKTISNIDSGVYSNCVSPHHEQEPCARSRTTSQDLSAPGSRLTSTCDDAEQGYYLPADLDEDDFGPGYAGSWGTSVPMEAPDGDLTPRAPLGLQEYGIIYRNPFADLVNRPVEPPQKISARNCGFDHGGFQRDFENCNGLDAAGAPAGASHGGAGAFGGFNSQGSFAPMNRGAAGFTSNVGAGQGQFQRGIYGMKGNAGCAGFQSAMEPRFQAGQNDVRGNGAMGFVGSGSGYSGFQNGSWGGSTVMGNGAIAAGSAVGSQPQGQAQGQMPYAPEPPSGMAAEEAEMWMTLQATKVIRPPPPGYICHACYRPGHFIADCDRKSIRDGATTPYQGPKRCLGRFMCPRCKHAWFSRCSYANKAQKCKKCRITVYPHKQARPEDDDMTTIVDFTIDPQPQGQLPWIGQGRFQ